MNQTEYRQAVERLTQEVRELTYQLDEIHRTLQEFENWIIRLEDESDAAGLPRLNDALRDTYQKLIKASQALVEAHLTLNLPMTAFQRNPFPPG